MNKPSDYQSKKPIQKRSLNTRQKILDASIVLIADIGFEKTNTNLIAELAEVSVGTIYVHFKDKWEIFLTILDEFSQRIFNFLNPGIEDLLNRKAGIGEVIEWLIRGLYREHQLNGKLNLEIALFVLKDERAAELRSYWDRKIDEEVIRLFEHYREQLPEINIEAAVTMAHRSAHQVFQFLYQNKDNVDSEAILKEFILMLKRYLCA